MNATNTSHILLLGAGFSRNWGGWLADEVGNYLLACPEIKNNPVLRSVLTRHADSGFEAALSELQTTYLQSRSADAKRNVDDLQKGIVRMFGTMDRGFRDTQFEFQSDGKYMVRTFLNRFDAIFTLNQDYLLERHYLNDNVMLASGGRWKGWQIPGMIRVHDPSRQPLDLTPVTWKPDPGGFQVHKGYQPYFKLHGSSNWITNEGERLLIIGSNKLSRIQGQDVLRHFLDTLTGYLAQSSKLMIIGYGFRDEHINATLVEAAHRGQLQLFVIDELGRKALDQNNRTLHAPIYVPSDPAQSLGPALIGASRRRLSETFKDDRVEHALLMGFFDN